MSNKIKFVSFLIPSLILVLVMFFSFSSNPEREKGWQARENYRFINLEVYSNKLNGFSRLQGEDTKILHVGEFKIGKGKFHYYDWRESEELVKHRNEYPFILTTGRELQHYNCATMTRRTANAEILPKDVIMLNPKDAKDKNLLTGDRATLKSDRGEVTLEVEVTDRVKRGIVRTTFHFPEVLINEVTSGVADEETKCPEYKVVAVDVLKAS